MKDFYYILGIPKSATISEIKTAYRKLSHKFHPDHNDGDKFFEERFKDIDEAYKTLVDVNSRRAYDLKVFGSADRPSNETHQPNESGPNDENKNASSEKTHYQTKEEKYDSTKTKKPPSASSNEKHLNFNRKHLDTFYTVFGLASGLAVILLLLFGPGKTTLKPIHQTNILPQASFTPASVPVYPTIKVDSLIDRMQQEGIASSLARAVDSLKTKKAKHFGREYITIGSTKDEVIRIQGTPSSITGPPMYEEWSYGLSSVVFEGGILKAYNNFEHNLRIRMNSQPQEHGAVSVYFTIGSTKNDVLKVQGTPSSITGPPAYEEWSYGLSSVIFEWGRVKSFNNFDQNLHIRMK